MKIGLCVEHLNIEAYKATNLDECHTLVTSVTFDIFIIDRSIIGFGKFSIEEHIKRIGYIAPVLVFNEDKNDELLDYWLSKYNGSEYISTIKELAAAVLLPPTEVINQYIVEGNTKQHISGKTQNILLILLENVDKFLSTQEIDLKLKEKGQGIKKDVLYTYVSKLRRLCSSCSNCINIKMQNGNYMLHVKGFFKNEKASQ